MKQCSQCHFTFEDHEQFCDFDATELTPCPEPLAAARDASLLFGGSPFVRLFRSRVSLTCLALAGVISSALLIGYCDAESQTKVDTQGNSDTRDSAVSLANAPNQPPGEPRVQPSVHSRSQTLAHSMVQISTRGRFQTRARSQIQASVRRRSQPAAQSRVQASARRRSQPAAQSQVQPSAKTASATVRGQRSTPAAKPPVPWPPTTAPLSRAEVRSSVPNRNEPRAVENSHLKKEPAPTTILKKTANVLKKTITLLRKPFDL
jgi:hypothetical protein